jgi:hypothetical protein
MLSGGYLWERRAERSSHPDSAFIFTMRRTGTIQHCNVRKPGGETCYSLGFAELNFDMRIKIPAGRENSDLSPNCTAKALKGKCFHGLIRSTLVLEGDRIGGRIFGFA